MTHYWVRPEDRPDIALLARKNRAADEDLLKRLFRWSKRPVPVEPWAPLQLQVSRGHRIEPVTPTNLPLRLHSSPLRQAIDRAEPTGDDVQWLPVDVDLGQGASERHWHLHFASNRFEVVDQERSVYGGAPGVLMKSYVLEEAIRNLDLLYPPTRSCLTYVVSERLREAMLSAGCSEGNFSPVLSS